MALTQVDQGLLGTYAQYTGFKNRIINGAMVIDQRNAGASVTPTSGTYTLDRWQVALTQASKISVQQNAGSVTPPVGFTTYAGITSLSAYSVVAGDFFVFAQNIEGYNISDFAWGTANAKSVTFSFQVYSSLTGTFSGYVTNDSGTRRYYPFTYTVSSANTWTTVSVTIPGCTDGTWTYTNARGLAIGFCLGIGSTYGGQPANAWTGSASFGVSTATSVVGTNGATFYITGVQLEKGSTATSFDYRPYGTELALCQRYYWQSKNYANTAQMYEYPGAIISTSQARMQFNLPVPMRTTPSFALNPVYNTGTGWSINLTSINNYVLNQIPTVLGYDGAGGSTSIVSLLWTTGSAISSSYYGLSAIPYSPTGVSTNNFQFSAEL